MTGNTEKTTRNQIIKAVKDGKPFSDIEGIIISNIEEESPVSIERYARTKYTELMNRARIEEFESTGIVEAYQYSAIMDDRTSDICAGLDGKIFDYADAPIPPMHFNCRSLLVPITKFEDYTIDTTAYDPEKEKDVPIDSFIDDQLDETGFSRFSRPEKPQITDQGVDFKIFSDDLIDVYTYSKDGKAFEEITITYSDVNRNRVVSKTSKRLDDGDKV